MPPIPATIAAGTDKPGEPSTNPIIKMTPPINNKLTGHSVYLSKKLLKAGTVWFNKNHAPAKTRITPSASCERLPLIAQSPKMNLFYLVYNFLLKKESLERYTQTT